MKRLLNLALTLIVFLLNFLFISPAFAKEKPLGTFEGISPLQPHIAVFGDLGLAINTFAKILSNVVGFLTLVGGLLFLIYFMIGGFSWITAGGKPENIQKAQDMITNAVIGLIIMVAAYSIAFIVSQVLGIDFLDIRKVVTKLGPGS